MRRFRKITLADIPASVGIMKPPKQTIFARTEQGGVYLDPNHPDTLATATAWFGWTNQPVPASKRKGYGPYKPKD